MKTITNYLIANMAVSDILITVLAVPMQITEILLGPHRWLIDGLLGSVLCKSAHFFQDITIGVSILSLLAIAVDRYRGIVFPLRKQLRKPAKICKIIVPTIWLISIGLHAIYFYIFRLVTADSKTYCAPKFDQKKSQEAHFTVTFVCLIAIPTCVVTFLYSAVILNLNRSRHTCTRGQGSSRSMKSERLREDKKVIRIIIVILLAFIVCVMPINLYAILFYFVWDWKIPCGMENFAFAAFFVLYSNASINPCIYFVLNNKYRQGLVNILKALPFVRKKATKSTEMFALVQLKNTVSSSGFSR